MTFRDDRDALLDQVAQLERRLAQAEAELSAAAGEEHAIDELKNAFEAERAATAARHTKERRADEIALSDAQAGLGRGGQRLLMVLGALCVVLLGGVVGLGYRLQERETMLSAELYTCLLQCPRSLGPDAGRRLRDLEDRFGRFNSHFPAAAEEAP